MCSADDDLVGSQLSSARRQASACLGDELLAIALLKHPGASRSERIRQDHHLCTHGDSVRQARGGLHFWPLPTELAHPSKEGADNEITIRNSIVTKDTILALDNKINKKQFNKQ